MQSIILFTVLCVFRGVTTQASTPISTLTLASAPPNWEELSPETLKDTIKAKKDKFSCVLNLLKSALSEELEHSQFQINEETKTDSILSSLSNVIDEEHEDELEKDSIKQNETDSEKALYQKLITKIASAFSKPAETTTNKSNVEIPNMIPIFKQRMAPPRNEMKQNIADCNPPSSARQISNPRAVAFVPEKIVQTNMNLISSQPMFNIPCQRAADVLNMDIAIPEEVCRNENANVNPVVEAPKPNLPNQTPTSITLSVNCADSEDTVAMLFKPKDISLMQLYGNLLKKITITVLVPYHMSKLAGK